MKAALAILVLAAGTASADPVEAVVRARLAPVLSEGLGIAQVHLPPSLASLDVSPAEVTVEVPGALERGRPSIKVTVKRRKTVYVPVTVAKLVAVAVATRPLAEGETVGASDVELAWRATDAAPGSPAAFVGATVTHRVAAGDVVRPADVVLAPPLARGTQVTVEMRRGSVRVRGTATLESAARPGQSTVVRVGQTRTVVRGVLVAPSTVVVGEAP